MYKRQDYACDDADNDGICDDVDDCVGEYDDCGVCNGDGSSCESYLVDIYYNSDTDIAGFQFNMDGVEVLGASGGDAEANGFSVSTSATTVLGFSFTGSVVPAGAGVLTTLQVVGSDACITDLVLSGSGGEGLDADIVDLSLIHI